MKLLIINKKILHIILIKLQYFIIKKKIFVIKIYTFVKFKIMILIE